MVSVDLTLHYSTAISVLIQLLISKLKLSELTREAIIRIFCTSGDNCALDKVRAFFSKLIPTEIQLENKNFLEEIINTDRQSDAGILG